MIHKQLTTIDVSTLNTNGDTMCFHYTDPFGQPAHGFVIRFEDQLYAYRNLCPHWGVALDHDEQFLDDTGQELMCQMHGATFDPTTGACTFGPPEGSRLEAFVLQEVPDEPHLRMVLRAGGITL